MSLSIHIVEQVTDRGASVVSAHTERSAKVGGYTSAWAAANVAAEDLLRHGAEGVIRTVHIHRQDGLLVEEETGRWTQRDLDLFEKVVDLIRAFHDFAETEEVPNAAA